MTEMVTPTPGVGVKPLEAPLETILAAPEEKPKPKPWENPTLKAVQLQIEPGKLTMIAGAARRVLKRAQSCQHGARSALQPRHTY